MDLVTFEEGMVRLTSPNFMRLKQVSSLHMNVGGSEPNGKLPQEAVDFAGAYSALAHTFPGDFNWATVEEAEKAIKAGSLRICC